MTGSNHFHLLAFMPFLLLRSDEDLRPALSGVRIAGALAPRGRFDPDATASGRGLFQVPGVTRAAL